MYIKSPLNYIGGKYKILPKIFEIFPNKIGTFVDLFAGGFNVGINVDADKIICNDHMDCIIDLYKFFKYTAIDDIIEGIKQRIDEFKLSLSNQEGYNLLRQRYNAGKDVLDFFVLICYSFNHQIRFNNKKEFNTSFGKNRSSYNINIEKKLKDFCLALKNKQIEFFSNDFLNVNLSNLCGEDLVYCDPPYIISTAPYNDGKRGFKNWTEKEEKELLNLLDSLNRKNIKFALSNVLYHKGLSNDLLINWSEKYNVYYIDHSYNNCNHQFKYKNNKSVEVLITNFK